MTLSPTIFASAKTLLFPAALLAATVVPVLAQGMPGDRPFGGGWRDRGGADGYDQRIGGRQTSQPSKRIDVTAYRAADAEALLGKGRIVVSPAPVGAGGDGEGDGDGLGDTKLPVYEAAVIDELARRGYDTNVGSIAANDPGQIAEIGVSHSVAVPAEAPHKKVSGEMSTTIGNRGSGFGLGLAIDLTKPAKAIVATRLDLRIRDKASGRILWEGHAEGQARGGDAGLDNGAMATRLAGALLKTFPQGEVVQPIAMVTP